MYEDERDERLERDKRYGSAKKAAPEDARKAYVKWTAKETKDLPAHFRRPDYKASMNPEAEEASQPVLEEAKEENPLPQVKKKEEYEL